MAYWFQLDGINCDILQLLCGFSALYLFIFCLFVYILVYPFNRLLACWLAFRLAGLRVCGLAGSRACFWAPNSGVLIQLQVWHRSRRFPRFKLWLYLQTCRMNVLQCERCWHVCSWHFNYKFILHYGNDGHDSKQNRGLTMFAKTSMLGWHVFSLFRRSWKNIAFHLGGAFLSHRRLGC